MIVSPDILRRDTIKLIQAIDAQIKEITDLAESRGVSPHKMQDTNGNWLMSPLLQAKALAYNSLVLLQTKK